GCRTGNPAAKTGNGRTDKAIAQANQKPKHAVEKTTGRPETFLRRSRSYSRGRNTLCCYLCGNYFRMHKLSMTSGALLAAIAVVLGAFGAHALKAVLQPEQLQVFETGVRY